MTRPFERSTKTQKIFGIHSLFEAIDSGKELEKVMIDKDLGSGRIKELKDKLRLHEIPFQLVPKDTLNRLAGPKHQGVLAYGSLVEYSKLESIIPQCFDQGKDPFILILDGITDVRNFGAIARTADCAGVHAIVIPFKGSAQVNADAIKTSSGALHSISICRTQSLKDTVKFLKDSGLVIVAATEKGNSMYHEHELGGPMAYILGSEELGISTPLLQMADHLVKIPVMGQIGSLNVSVAAGILMYERLRQTESIK